MEKKIYVRDVLEYADVKELLMCEREESREEGREKGREERIRQLALNMLAKGLDPALIAEISGLTEEDILALVQN